MSAIFHAGISGYRGRMGRAVSQVLDARDDVVVAARIDWGDEADLSLCDVVIDFSTAEASLALAQAAFNFDACAVRRLHRRNKLFDYTDSHTYLQS